MSRARLAGCCCAAVMLLGCRPAPKCLYTQYERVHGSVTIASSRDFAQLEGRCILVRGSLRIEDPDAVDLGGLEGIVGVGGSLHIVGATSLESTAGLESLEFVGHDVEIVDDPALTELDLPALRSVGGSVELGYLPALASLVGMPVLTDVGGDVFVHDLPALWAWDLEAVEAVGRHLRIESNPALVEIDGPDTLFSVGWHLSIAGNFELESVTGFDGLDRVGGAVLVAAESDVAENAWVPPRPALVPGRASGFFVSEVPHLHHVSGFGSLVEIEHDLRIEGNPALAGLDLLPALGRVGEIQINSNASLTTYPRWDSVDAGALVVFDQPRLDDLSSFSGVLFDSGHFFSNSDLRSLDGLTLSESALMLEVADNPALEGLGSIAASSLIYVGIHSNPGLIDVGALRKLERVSSIIYIVDNSDLDQSHAEDSVAHLEPQVSKKVAANQGWSVPEECPWANDGACDERDDYGPALCMPGTDGEDCA